MVLVLVILLSFYSYSSEMYPSPSSDEMSDGGVEVRRLQYRDRGDRSYEPSPRAYTPSSPSSPMEDSYSPTTSDSSDMQGDFGSLSFFEPTPVMNEEKVSILQNAIDKEQRKIRLATSVCNKQLLDMLIKKASGLSEGVEMVVNQPIDDEMLPDKFSIIVDTRAKIDGTFMIFDGQRVALVDSVLGCQSSRYNLPRCISDTLSLKNFDNYYKAIKSSGPCTYEGSIFHFTDPKGSDLSEKITSFINCERSTLKLWITALNNPRIAQALQHAAVKTVNLQILINGKLDSEQKRLLAPIDLHHTVQIRLEETKEDSSRPCTSLLVGERNDFNISRRMALIGSLRAYRKETGAWGWLQEVKDTEECARLAADFDVRFTRATIVPVARD